ncbi:MAG: glycine betaine/L-proline ABC transporter ATP-binding protein ProV [Oleispira antarctica]|uniref:Quaternary amine transport ATP-binding protein n=1 Tax=Oleispira antarctica RB-8 TaxID=698738 RepID=R4YUT3_OLEAN|nr:glycine betaine/L-proline ABC transporter ATP-binding protein ProV [Oleispira antarctica]MBQ0791806.1 glycine betaine/L-proline ABC transporter ATP-binding protein ProV [Oleispira antarctica]CCK76999.1 Glycine betaine/L-proline ABC transporter, ATP-binding protein [Oleispira antarctica RB-8]
MSYKLEVKNLYKVFGNKPKKAIQMLESGATKDTIFSQTGMTVGVQNASLQIKEGEIFVIMGLSGSGKSTLVRLLNRLIEPTLGQVLIDGEDITRLDKKSLRAVRRNKVSMVFQSFALLPHLTVLDNAAFGLELSGEPKDVRYEKAMNALNQVGLEAYALSYPDELSGGMQQRVGLARALANDPDILLMDEAFSALDPLIRAEMQDELVNLQKAQRRTIIFISHDLDEAMRIGDRIAIMQGGKIIQVGQPDEILQNPANDYVKSFFKGVDVSNVFNAGDIATQGDVKVIKQAADVDLSLAMTQLNNDESEYAYITDENDHLRGVISTEDLANNLSNQSQLENAFIDLESITDTTQINEVIGQVAASPCPVPVVDKDNKYQGVISQNQLLETLDRESKDE